MRIALSSFLTGGILFALLSSGPANSRAKQSATPAVSSAAVVSCSIVYAGFVGAMETSNHAHSGVVQIRDILREPANSDICAASFIPISWTSGRDWVLTHFPSHS